MDVFLRGLFVLESEVNLAKRLLIFGHVMSDSLFSAGFPGTPTYVRLGDGYAYGVPVTMRADHKYSLQAIQLCFLVSNS